MHKLVPVLVLCFCSAAVATGDEAAVRRFVARLSNGERLAGDELTDWDRLGGAPQLGGQALLGESPFRWLLDRTVVPLRDSHGTRLELWLGDQVPGELLGYVPPQSLPATPGHFLFRVDAELQPRPSASAPPMRILSRWVKRIVLADALGETPLTPGALRLRDGQVIEFRVARLEPDRVVVSTAAGRASANWNELAEICFPPPSDHWQLQWEQRAALAPSGEGRLLELHTNDQLVVTTSLARLEHRALSNGPTSDMWVHGAHPAWSLDAFWIPSKRVWLRVSYALHEMPLSRLEPTAYEHEPLIGAARDWRRDRSVRGETLLSGGRNAGWGIGVHSGTRLTFDLPAQVSRLRGAVALDDSAGAGGCVRGSIRAGNRAAFTSPHLVGSAAEASFDIDLRQGRPLDQPLQVALEIDAAHEGRPAGADPLDIRDQTNWLEPLLEFDAEWVAERCRALAAAHVTAWEDWQFWSPGETTWSTEWDQLAPSPGAFAVRLKTSAPTMLARKLRRLPGQQYLVLSVSNADSNQPALLEVHSEGRLLLQRNVPERSARSPAMPLIVAPLYSLPVEEETDLVVTVSSAEPVSLRWQAATLSASHPEYLSLYDEQSHPDAVDGREQAYTGERCLRLREGQTFRHEFRPPMPFRYRPAPHEARYIRFAVKSQNQGLLAFRVKVRGEDQPVLYDVGQGPLTEGRARRIFTQPISDSWLAVSRDLCGDLRDADIEWVEFAAERGEVLIDQAYVGRGGGGAWNDLETPLGPPWNLPDQRRALAEALGPRVGAGVVAIQFPDGRTGEGICLDDKHVLTVGDALPVGDAVLRITTADGRQADAKPLGVDRDRNWGVLQWTGPEPLRDAPPRLDGATSVPFSAAMVEAGLGGRDAFTLTAGPLPSGRLVSLQPLTSPAAIIGRPLIAASGQVLGLRAGSNQLRYIPLAEFARQFKALLEPKREGDWQLGEGPRLGMILRWGEVGAEVVDVAASSRAAGIQPGDVILEIAGQPVRDAWSAHRAIRGQDPGQEVALRWARGDREPRELTLRLGFPE